MSAREAVHLAVETAWRSESAKVIASVARIVRDVGLAEEIAQDALVAALEHWPRDGIPDKPGAWLMTTAKNRGLDRLRQHSLHARKQEQLGHEMDALQSHVEPDFVDALDAARQDDIGDDLLRLIFTACHPLLPAEGRVALTLRLLGGLRTDEIARAYLVPEPTIAQRIVRAKRMLRDAQVPYDVPRGPGLQARLASVLEVIYLIFNEGYAATQGDHWTRPPLCEEALRLGRILSDLAPQESEVHGLMALMELQASRLAARIDAQGHPVLLMDQDRSRWDAPQIRRGLAALDRAIGTPGALGPYRVQAAIAACHARATRAEDTDWLQIVGWYDVLLRVAPSPIVELNRAVAVGMAHGPEQGLALADVLLQEPTLATYHFLPAVRADFLQKLGRDAQAREEFLRAAEMTTNTREREFLMAKASAFNS